MHDLPEVIPVFALPNFVLFPDVKVPLHIFEPRYRAMVADVATGHRIVGMMLLKGDWERDYYAYPDIYQVGCAGRIVELVELRDGCFNLLLEGVAEYRVQRELRDRPYRRAQVKWRQAEDACLEPDPSMLETLRELLSTYLGPAASGAWHSLVEQHGRSGAGLVNSLCFHLDISPLEKQTLLEALDNRLGCLLDVLAFKLEERKLGPGWPKPGGERVH